LKHKEIREISEKDVMMSATSFGSRTPKTEEIYLDLLEQQEAEIMILVL
jgi:hypothetical protein